MKDYLQRGDWLIELKGNFLLISTPVMARAMQDGRKESQKTSGRRWRQQDLRQKILRHHCLAHVHAFLQDVAFRKQLICKI